MGEERDTMDLTYKTIRMCDQNCYVMGKIFCGNVELYALESDRSRHLYDGRCPVCRRIHVHFNDPTKGYYAFVQHIHDMI